MLLFRISNEIKLLAVHVANVYRVISNYAN